MGDLQDWNCDEKQWFRASNEGTFSLCERKRASIEQHDSHKTERKFSITQRLTEIPYFPTPLYNSRESNILQYAWVVNDSLIKKGEILPEKSKRCAGQRQERQHIVELPVIAWWRCHLPGSANYVQRPGTCTSLHTLRLWAAFTS